MWGRNVNILIQNVYKDYFLLTTDPVGVLETLYFVFHHFNSSRGGGSPV